MNPLGAALAGGASSRFGAPKPLALVGGRSIVGRVMDAMHAVTDEVVLIANDPDVAASAADARPDEVPGQGPLGGVVTALGCAKASGRPGALCVACDMPFVSPALLRAILTVAAEHPAAVVVPESVGRRGYEPLCAYYPVEALPAARAALQAGEGAPYRLIEQAVTRRVGLAAVRAIGDPEILFFNVNTQEDLDRAERIARGAP